MNREKQHVIVLTDLELRTVMEVTVTHRWYKRPSNSDRLQKLNRVCNNIVQKIEVTLLSNNPKNI